MGIEDTLYFQAKKLYVARMRLAIAFEKGIIGRFIWRLIKRLNNILK